MQKPSRKNSHKERIFSLPQNKIDFSYQKEHQDRAAKEHEASLNSQAPSLLEPHKARKSLTSIVGWQLTSDHKMIYREFILSNFMAAVDMIDRIALIAQGEKHHPDIHLTQCHILRVGLTTHDVGGLSEKDLTVARKINELPLSNKAVALDQQLQNKEQPAKENSIIKNQPKLERKDKLTQKNVRVKQTKGTSLVLKKSSDKTKVSKPKKSSNRIRQTIKKA